MIRLLIESAGRSDQFETADAVVTIGRTEANTLCVADEGLSRQHCRIERLADGSFQVADLASRNGTFVNGRRIDEHVLRPGDRIRIGSTTITFEPVAGEAAPVAGQEAPPAATEAQAEAQPGAPRAIRLLFTAGPAQGKSQVVFGKLTTIGRSPRNDIVIDEGGVSNRHAEIRREPDGFMLIDAGSRNGTFLNGHLVSRAPLAPGDQILIGRAAIQVADAAEAPAAESSATKAAPAPEPAPEPSAETKPPRAARGSRLTLLVPAAALLVVGVTALVLFRGALARWFAPLATSAPGDLLGGRGAFETAAAKLAWLREDDADGELAGGHLAIHLPPRGPVGTPASFRLAKPLRVRADRNYTVSARIRATDGSSTDAALLLTWRGPASWRPRAEVLVRPRAGSEGWGQANRTLVPPAWARSLAVACMASGRGGEAGFDDISVAARDSGEALPRLEAGPLVVTMDAPALFSLSHGGDLVAAGAGLVVRREGMAPLRLWRARPAQGYPKFEDGRHELRASATLPGRAARRPEVTFHHTIVAGQDAVHLEYRVWASEKTPLDFVGLELAGPAAPPRAGLDVRTPAGFGRERVEDGPLVVDDVLALAWIAGSGRVFVEAASPVSLDCRVDEERAVWRIGRRGLSLGPEPFVLQLTLRGSTADGERGIAEDLAEAERAVREQRLGDAVRRYLRLAAGGPRRPEAERARRRLAELRRRAARDAEAALERLERARLSGRADDFAAARAALLPLKGLLAGTRLGATVAAGLAACESEGRAAETRRRETAAAILLDAARTHHREGRRHIARLHCAEVLAHFAGTRAEADARTLLEALDQPPLPREPKAPELPLGAPEPAPKPVPRPAPPPPTAIPVPPGPPQPAPDSGTIPPPGPRPDERNP